MILGYSGISTQLLRKSRAHINAICNRRNGTNCRRIITDRLRWASDSESRRQWEKKVKQLLIDRVDCWEYWTRSCDSIKVRRKSNRIVICTFQALYIIFLKEYWWHLREARYEPPAVFSTFSTSPFFRPRVLVPTLRHSELRSHRRNNMNLYHAIGQCRKVDGIICRDELT